jgi:hypothetical protein
LQRQKVLMRRMTMKMKRGKWIVPQDDVRPDAPPSIFQSPYVSSILICKLGRRVFPGI